MKKIDFHVHITNRIPIDDTVRLFQNLCERKGYLGVGIMALSHSGNDDFPDCNRDALKIKKQMPGSAAFAALFHDEDFVEQAKRRMDEGFDGIKLLEGKPTHFKHYGYGFSHPRFDAFFAFAEEQGIPLMIHNNDPRTFWDVNKASERARKKGWVYDESTPSFAYFTQALEKVFNDHPNLRAAVAHMGFLAHDLDHMERLLENYPNLMFDITPAVEIYGDVSSDPIRAQRFFEKFQNRLIYGTDARNSLNENAIRFNDMKTEMISTFLEGGSPRKVGDYEISPISLGEEALENIYYHNAMRLIKK